MEVLVSYGCSNKLLQTWWLKGAPQMVLVVKNLPANARAGDVRDTGLIPGLGRTPGGGNDNPLQYSSLGNPTDRGAWWFTIHRVTKSQTQLKQLSMYSGLKQYTCIISLFKN